MLRLTSTGTYVRAKTITTTCEQDFERKTDGEAGNATAGRAGDGERLHIYIYIYISYGYMEVLTAPSPNVRAGGENIPRLQSHAGMKGFRLGKLRDM